MVSMCVVRQAPVMRVMAHPFIWVHGLWLRGISAATVVVGEALASWRPLKVFKCEESRNRYHQTSVTLDRLCNPARTGEREKIVCSP